MAVFYNKERAKYGNLTGQIIVWPMESTVKRSPQKVPNNPKNINNPIIYLEYSLASSNLKDIESRMDLIEVADRVISYL